MENIQVFDRQTKVNEHLTCDEQRGEMQLFEMLHFDDFKHGVSGCDLICNGFVLYL